MASSDLRESLGRVASAQMASASAIGLERCWRSASPMVGRQACDRLLDAVEMADAVEGLLGDRRADGGMDVEEFAADMGPAGGLGDPVAGEQLVEPGIAVGVDDAAEVFEMRPRVLALAVGRVEEQRRRRSRAGERPLVADIGPQPPGLGLAGARRQHRHRRVVDMQRVRGHHIGGKRVDQRLQRRRRRADPAGQSRGFQADPLAGEDLGLAVERQMVVVLRDDDVREKPRPARPRAIA